MMPPKRPQNQTHLGEFLKRKRLQAGLKQSDVAEMLGFTTPQFISSIERGKKSLPIDKIPTIAELYGIPLDDLIRAVQDEQLRLFNLKLKKLEST